MAVFSFIKRGRQAAKEHNAKQAEKEKMEQQKTPYKHVPKHAALDALSGGPATWRDADRPKILENNRRRSAMTASGINMGGMMTPVHQGMPRVNSALSHVSYPSAYASPVVHFPRAYSYSSMPAPGWSHQGGDISYSPLTVGPMSGKGKEVERVMVDSGRASRASSHGSSGPSPPGGLQNDKEGGGSPVGSSSNSTSSQDDLEMRPVKHASSSTKPAGEPEPLHRLHPSHARRTSDSNQFRNSVPSPRYGTSRDSSSASLAAAGIPPVPAIPPMQFGTTLSSSVPTSSASSTNSSITIVPGSSSVSVSKLATPVTAPIPRPVVEEEESENEAGVPIGVATPPDPMQTNRRTSKYTRFSELSTINSEISADVQNIGPTLGPEKEKGRPISTVTALPTMFDEASLPSHQQPVLPPPKSGKLSKNPSAKLSKKNRWSLRSSKSTVLAV